MYAREGRPSIAPEKLLRALVVQMLYSVRSERLLMEEMDYNILFRWFVGLNLDDEVWDATTFTKNRERLLEADVAKRFLAAVVERAREKGFVSDSTSRWTGRCWRRGRVPSHERDPARSAEPWCGSPKLGRVSVTFTRQPRFNRSRGSAVHHKDPPTWNGVHKRTSGRTRQNFGLAAKSL